MSDYVCIRERVTAVIPAHNEEASIGATIQSIRANGVNRVIAVLDNCTDNTERVALAENAECFETVDNVDKKAGALNQALTTLLDTAPDDHLVLVTDADTEIAPEFITTALHALSEGADAVGVYSRVVLHGTSSRRAKRTSMPDMQERLIEPDG